MSIEISRLGRTIAGFVIAPVVPGLVLAAAMLALSESEDAFLVFSTNVAFGYPASPSLAHEQQLAWQS